MKTFFTNGWDDPAAFMRDAYQYGTRDKVVIGGADAVQALTTAHGFGAARTTYIVTKMIASDTAYVIERELYNVLVGQPA